MGVSAQDNIRGAAARRKALAVAFPARRAGGDPPLFGIAERTVLFANAATPFERSNYQGTDVPRSPCASGSSMERAAEWTIIQRPDEGLFGTLTSSATCSQTGLVIASPAAAAGVAGRCVARGAAALTAGAVRLRSGIVAETAVTGEARAS